MPPAPQTIHLHRAHGRWQMSVDDCSSITTIWPATTSFAAVAGQLRRAQPQNTVLNVERLRQLRATGADPARAARFGRARIVRSNVPLDAVWDGPLQPPLSTDHQAPHHAARELQQQIRRRSQRTPLQRFARLVRTCLIDQRR